MLKYIAQILLILGGLLGSLLLAAIVGHQLVGIKWVVLYSGYIGSGLILCSMIYSVRKRYWKGLGSLKFWLIFHEYAALFGALLIFFHAAWRFRAGIPMIALIMMILVVLSGFFGKELYLNLVYHQDVIKKVGYSSTFEFARKRLKKWRELHVQVSVSLFVFTALHIFLIGYFGGFK